MLEIFDGESRPWMRIGGFRWGLKVLVGVRFIC